MTADEVFAFFLKRLSTYDEPIKYEKIILKDQTDYDYHSQVITINSNSYKFIPITFHIPTGYKVMGVQANYRVALDQGVSKEFNFVMAIDNTTSGVIKQGILGTNWSSSPTIDLRDLPFYILYVKE